MSKPNQLTGMKFGKLTVIKRVENDKHGKTRWLCKCDCGNQKVINGSSLTRGLTVSCGCNRIQKLKKYNETKVVDETGHKYGYLTVISRNTNPNLQKDGRAMWNCICKCGKQCVIAGKHLRDGHVTSCGCRRQSIGEEKIEQLLLQNNIDYSLEYSVNVRKERIYQHHKARFDFAIFKNNQLQYFIEFDGEQHFNDRHPNWKASLEKTQERDQLKNQWCWDNNIPLIRIPYTHLNQLCLEDLLLKTSDFIVNKENK